MEVLLWHISATGEITNFNVLKETNFNLNIYNKASFSPLQNACSRGYAHCVEIFLENGADINRKDDYGATPLSIACDENQIECVKILLKYGAEITSSIIKCAHQRKYFDLVWLLQENNIIKEPGFE